jgi:hypothetical protein
MKQARLHWFWRAVIALVIGVPINEGGSISAFAVLPESIKASQLFLIAHVVVRATIPLVAYGLLTLWLGPRFPADRETRCRRCDYNLRGISEPICPECGERI